MHYNWRLNLLQTITICWVKYHGTANALQLEAEFITDHYNLLGEILQNF